MIKWVKSIAAACSVAVIAINIVPLSACAGDLTQDELFEKYGFLCSIEQVILVNNSDIDNRNYYAYEHSSPMDYPFLGETMSIGTCNGFSYAILDSECVCITGIDFETVTEETSTLQIPSEIEDLPVKAIGYGAFWSAKAALPSLTSIHIPDTVEVIAPYAFCCTFGSFSNGITESDWSAGYSLNIPEQVKFIGSNAYSSAAFALLSDSNERIIHLPESLEYISATAFDNAIGSRVFSQYSIEVDMPDSLVFMSDDRFHSDRAWIGGAGIDECSRSYKLANNIAPEDMPLMLSISGKGFLDAQYNICTMKDILRAFLSDESATQDCPLPFSFESVVSYNRLVNCESYDQLIEMAKTNAPELLPMSVEKVAGDINGDGIISISDAIMMRRVLAEDYNDNVSALYNLSAADCDRNGIVDLKDFRTILRSIQ